MPNWCKGELRVRGSWENIVKFLTEYIEPSNLGDPEDIRIFFYKEEVDSDTYGLEFVTKKWAHIKGTRRGFIVEQNRDFWKEQGEENTIISLESSFAWGIDVENLRNLSEELGIDFRIYGFERGMEFNQDIEIIAGTVTKNEIISFSCYTWECIDPNKGG